MKKLVVSVVSAVALTTAGMAAANHSMAASDQSFSSDNNSARGVFVSGDVGAGFVGIKKSDYGTNVTKFRDYGFAWAANLGYQFNKYLALEAGYLNLGQSKATYTHAGQTVTEKNTFGGFDAAVKGILPVTSQFSLFGKAGAVDEHDDADLSVAGVSSRQHSNKWVPMVGLGTSFNLTDNVALNVQDIYAFRTNYKYKGISTFMPGINSVLAGVSYKFNV